MESIGIEKTKDGKYYELHHIVCETASFAQEARNILKNFGIGINSVANGVYLSGHRGRHTREYSRIVFERLNQAKTREEALIILYGLRLDLLGGRLDLYRK